MTNRPALLYLIRLIKEPNKDHCLELWWSNEEEFEAAHGSSHNHQAWPGGYLDHVTDVMDIASHLYPSMDRMGRLPFSLSDALLVLFLHDLEKPWKEKIPRTENGFKFDRKVFREKKIAEFSIELTEAQSNALRYVEGEGEDYSSKHRVMNELAAFCHMCDVASARIWHSGR